MTRLILLLSAILVTVMVNLGFSQVDFSQVVPDDPELRKGVLENGMTYYIRHNEEPKERASFYIIQNVGALMEEDNQNGLAHFLEHMSFNGTENFEGKGILHTLEKHGVAFGRNINAYTSFNQTVYNLSEIPTTHEGLVDTCLLILHDWSNYLLLTDEEIDLERGVITEEWRTRRTSNFRMRTKWFPVLFKGSKWAVRDVIGDTTVIKYHEPETLRKFYHDWYRTDLQAIAVVGDVDVDAVEKEIIEMFSVIPAVENEIPRPHFKIPSHDETYYVLATDPEATQSMISIYTLEENKDYQAKTLADFRESYMRSLYNMMSGMRINELLQKGIPPFVDGQTSISGFVRGYDTYVETVVANPNEEAKALEAIMIETERIKRYGFQEGELERAKTNLLTRLESQAKQKDKINNDRYCREYVGNYTSYEPVPGIDYEYEFAQKVLPTITADEILKKAKEWIKDTDRTIVITGPSEGVTHLTEDEAKGILAKVEEMDIEPYEDAASDASLISEELKGSKVKKTKTLDDFDAVEWTLANGVKVIYRHADYEKDNVQLMAYSKGGISLLPNELVSSGEMVETFIEAYGVGDFDAITLQKMLTGKKVSMSPALNDLTEGFHGSSAPKDFETMMQLLYLYFEHPRFDKEAHDALMARYVAYVANMQKNPQKIMQDSMTYIMANYNPRVRAFNTDYLADVSFDEIETIYKERIHDADDFTFFIVGNIDEDVACEMVQKYIGSLTSVKGSENWVDQHIDAPEGKTEKVIPIAFTTPKANVNIQYVDDYEYSLKNALLINALKGILTLRYTETVREKEGGTYGVRTRASLSQYPECEANLSMSFDCEPARASDLKAIIYSEFEKIVNEGPIDVDFDKTIKNMLKEREESREHNSFWLSSLYKYYYSGINTANEENYEKILESLTEEDVKDFASHIYNNADIIDVMFVPAED